jgi:acyl-CoA synthetase (AMP-forming)/AMP-acid ligase II
MSFWQLDNYRGNIAVIDAHDGERYTYEQVAELADLVRTYLPQEKKTFGIIYCYNQLPALIGYLAALRQHHSVCLLDGHMEMELRKTIEEAYQPAWIWQAESHVVPDGYNATFSWKSYVLLSRKNSTGYSVYADLGVLLSTSGTTGSPKLVRLSYENIESNAAAIAEYLKLTAEERPITTLPMQYSYGLSVINSHLAVGAVLLLTEDSVVNRSFWNFFKEHKATSLAGVPYTYQMLWKMRLPRMELPSLHTLTQAGGRLDVDLQEKYGQFAKETGRQFFVMYGQTEASPRLSYVPPERLLDKLGSIGVAIPGGRFELSDEHELIYYGPNVMLGYAHTYLDLAKGDEMYGRLPTGDLVSLDEDGFWYIIGRKKRFLKVFGLRINLDEVERMLEEHLGQPAFCLGTDDHLVIALLKEQDLDEIKALISQTYHLHYSAFVIRVMPDVPHTASGKVDYGRLQEMIKDDAR